eukprot:gnl/MRDRNA2_/MRDRNA2_85910_c0_seq1.p1 gnl/MRDRNA2_/MRDRNA2_85910_c0~~gnl/MRDRNA2_/MRDRNA2_85910_c0_seq1.p1  ORF type:complete len:465 (-),score=89.22 gnl/MRDRNA2_/MRDRNA2_85910_c0_seq1:38-1432(-)
MPAKSPGEPPSPLSPKPGFGRTSSPDSLGSPRSNNAAAAARDAAAAAREERKFKEEGGKGPMNHRTSLQEMSPAAYFLKHRQSAVDNLEALKEGRKASALLGPSPLMLLLRKIFDQLGDEPGALVITARSYNERVPELAKKYPQLAIHFRKMDVDNNATLDWDEFVKFSLSNEVNSATKRLNLVTVHGHETDPVSGQVYKTFKNPGDPARACEVGGPPPLLPWEKNQRVEWVIDELDADRKLLQVKYHGLEIPPGKYISSPPFDAAGIRGFFRFWPNGYFSNIQKRERGEMDLGGLRADAWCAIGVFFPHGTHLKFRFYVGDEYSTERECYWNDGALVKQIWTPDALEPPKLESFSVGIEVTRNLRQLHVAENIQRACTAGSKSGARGRLLSDKEKQAGVPGMRSLEPPALEKLPSPRLIKPWELPYVPQRPRLQLQKGGGLNASTFSYTGTLQMGTPRQSVTR